MSCAWPWVGTITGEGMAKNNETSGARTKQEVVILVHGTYATADEDEGLLWWQKGSDFYENLARQLPDHIRIVEPGEIFRWGGENNQLHRMAAARKLKDFVQTYEDQNIPYHIVAHSHGGSVAWYMICWAELRYAIDPTQQLARFLLRRYAKTKLPNLRNLITVGTPFIHLHPQKLFLRRSDIVKFLLKALFWVPVFIGIAFLASKLQADIGQNRVFGFWTFAGVFVISILAWILFAVSNLRVLPRQQAIIDGHLQRVLDLHGQKWSGLWSQDDEAIALLRAAQRLSQTPQILNGVQLDIPDELLGIKPGVLSLPSRLILRVFFLPTRIVVRLWIGFFLPLLDRLLKARLAGILLGMSQLNIVKSVEPWPHESLKRESPLPEAVQAELRTTCDAALANSSSGTRPALRHLSVGAVNDAMKAFGDTNNVLIHNSYFANSSVVDIIAGIISADRGARGTKNPPV